MRALSSLGLFVGGLFVGCLFLGFTSLTTSAAADVPPPGLEECGGRSAGDPCTVGGEAGACQDSTCSRLDYSNGTPPTTAQYPCTLCIAGATPTTPPAGGGCSVHAGGSSLAGLGVLAVLLVGLRRRRG